MEQACRELDTKYAEVKFPHSIPSRTAFTKQATEDRQLHRIHASTRRMKSAYAMMGKTVDKMADDAAKEVMERATIIRAESKVRMTRGTIAGRRSIFTRMLDKSQTLKARRRDGIREVQQQMHQLHRQYFYARGNPVTFSFELLALMRKVALQSIAV